MRIHPVILCGGEGRRLWPLSKVERPKPFLDLLGSGRSMLAETMARVADRSRFRSPFIVSNVRYRDLVAEELVEGCRLILEPASRNTAPAIALAALEIASVAGEDALMLVLPTDHYFEGGEIWCKTIDKARPIAESGKLVLFGIKPLAPDTGYGYIAPGNALPGGGFAVRSFIEKPPLAEAMKLMHSGAYWNRGIFLFRAGTYLEELERYVPEIVEYCRSAYEQRIQTNDCCLAGDCFLQAPSISIDVAVMEKTARTAMIPMEMEWADLGTWERLGQTRSNIT